MLMIRNAARLILMIGATAMLTGCAEFVDAYNKADAQNKVEQQASIDRQIKAINDGIENSCLSFGFKRGTDGFAGCKERGVKAKTAQMESELARQQAAQARADREYWDAYRARMSPRTPSSSNTDCSSTGNGNFSCTTTR